MTVDGRTGRSDAATFRGDPIVFVRHDLGDLAHRVDDVVTPAQLNVLRALLRCRRYEGRATFRTVAVEAGLTSVSTAWQHCEELRQLGLVEWDRHPDGRRSMSGTLRPTVRVVDVWP